MKRAAGVAIAVAALATTGSLWAGDRLGDRGRAHASADLAALPASPGRVSHGCIRLRNRDILRLALLMPVGTPVTIR